MMVMGDVRWAPDDGRWGQGMRHGPWVTGLAMGGCNPVNIHRRPSAFYQFLQGFQPLSNCLPILRPAAPSVCRFVCGFRRNPLTFVALPQGFDVLLAVFAAPPRLFSLSLTVLPFCLRFSPHPLDFFRPPSRFCRFACGFRPLTFLRAFYFIYLCCIYELETRITSSPKTGSQACLTFVHQTNGERCR